jgi:hypothetical protein
MPLTSQWRGYGLALLLLFGMTSPGRTDEGKADKLSVDDLNREVNALQTLYYLHVTPAQLEKLKAIAPETAAKPAGQAKVKASDGLRQKLLDLRAALVEATDEDEIDQLSEELQDQVTAEKAQLDTDFEVTDAARAKVPEVLKLLTARQVAEYLGNLAEDIPDPVELLTEALDKVRPLPPAKWKEFRDEISDQVGRLIGGIDPDKVQKASDEVVQFLIVVRSLKDDEFKAQRPELEKKARKILGDLGPTDILRHILEQTLAELLSNPRLSAAVAARLK